MYRWATDTIKGINTSMIELINNNNKIMQNLVACLWTHHFSTRRIKVGQPYTNSKPMTTQMNGSLVCTFDKFLTLDT